MPKSGLSDYVLGLGSWIEDYVLLFYVVNSSTINSDTPGSTSVSGLYLQKPITSYIWRRFFCLINTLKTVPTVLETNS